MSITHQLANSSIIGQHNPNLETIFVANSMAAKQGWHGLANIPKVPIQIHDAYKMGHSMLQVRQEKN